MSGVGQRPWEQSLMENRYPGLSSGRNDSYKSTDTTSADVRISLTLFSAVKPSIIP